MIDYWTAFVLGLAGSLHCAGMCGPLALALPLPGRAPMSFVFTRTAYNLGRIITYCLLGSIMGLVGKTLLLAGFQRFVSLTLGLLLLAGLFSSRRLGAWQPVITAVARLKAAMSPLLRSGSPLAAVCFGMLNGLLPCGLVYVAAAGATAAGSLAGGTGYMVAFGVGTLPMMLGIGFAGRLFPMPLRLKLQRAIPVSVFLVAALLILRGLALGIPFLSPDLSSPCCHR